MAASILLDLMGAVALLLWGLHMVHSGMVRALGADLRRLLGSALKTRWRAFLAGLAVTAVLQSSTATSLMVASFSAQGLIGDVPALAVMLGANVGTALVVQVLSLNISAAAPVLLLAGLIAFRRGARTVVRDLGRVGIGLGLMLLSLHSLIVTLAPAEHAPALRTVLAVITGDRLLNVLLGAALAWAAHSSVAVVLLVVSLSYSNFLTPVAALALVLGANLGSAINPVLESSSTRGAAGLRVPAGNLINRIVGCALLLPFLGTIAGFLSQAIPDPLHMAADFHLMFNLLLAGLFILPLASIARVLQRLFPEQRGAAHPGTPLYLDPAALETPTLALACAARESLHMGDVVQTMLEKTITALMTNDRKMVGEISRMDNIVDRLHEAVKLYVVKVTRQSLDEEEARRAMEIIAFVINLEHIGDIIDKNLMELAAKKIKRRLSFSREGTAELTAMHQRVLNDLKLAFGLLISGDSKVALQLLQEKREFRDAELAAAESHLDRLRQDLPQSIETSALHIDVLRDLTRIHTHICAAAYPILDGRGGAAVSKPVGDAGAGTASEPSLGNQPKSN